MTVTVAVCYLCEKEGADTTEHVVPRCFYPGKLPNDVITLPAHDACNKFTSKDEEAFRNHIAVAIPPDSPGHELWNKTWKAIHRPEGAGMQRSFYENMISVPEQGADGVVRARPVAARIKSERAQQVLAKIIKGLFVWKTKEHFFSEQTLWRFGQAENGRDQVQLPNAFSVHDVLDVRWGRANEESLTSVWILGFHTVAWFWVRTMSASQPSTEVQRDGVLMTWPGPKA
jgi:hypothetical protein